MQAFYNAFAYEFHLMKNILYRLCATMLLVPLVIRLGYRTQRAFTPFETAYAVLGAPFFVLGFIGLCALMAVRICAPWRSARAAYTMLTLPCGRLAVYLARIAALLTALAMFWASAVVNVLISYAFFMWQAQPFSGDIWSLVELRNGLFLALVRSPFLRIVLPLSGFNVWVVASTALSLTCSLYHGILCVRARKVPVTNFAALLLAVLAIAGMLSYRSGVTLFDLAAVAGASSVLILFHLWHGWRLVRTRAVI